MGKDPIWFKGYIAGYRDGVRDGVSGKTAQWQTSDILKMPIQAMELSSRAYRCLLYSGCEYVEDVIALTDDTIIKMRNLGRKTASEIAEWVTAHGIYHSDWSKYL